ncbi:unnamed protein product [Arabidopsis thaliana]|uniref:UDP-N-acetylglucosamine--dolichyl-phosphate N-acetylglucosaminephosphotransferase n=1 Tax=Arabidopsis thaliana TaxID=3702 RepID=A0A7G2ERW6_ARATH|nr:unnamed protein product [Arabidopsis thaliana]
MQIGASVDPEYHHARTFSIFLNQPLMATSLAMLAYNWCPSSVFVGDTYTVFAGTTVAVVGILGHFRVRKRPCAFYPEKASDDGLICNLCEHRFDSGEDRPAKRANFAAVSRSLTELQLQDSPVSILQYTSLGRRSGSDIISSALPRTAVQFREKMARRIRDMIRKPRFDSGLRLSGGDELAAGVHV